MSHDNQHQLCRDSRGHQGPEFTLGTDLSCSQSEETSSLLPTHLISDSTYIPSSRNPRQHGDPVVSKTCHLLAKTSNMRSCAQRGYPSSSGATAAAIETTAAASAFSTLQGYHTQRAAPRDLDGQIASNGNGSWSYDCESLGVTPDKTFDSTTLSVPATGAVSRKNYELPEYVVAGSSVVAQTANPHLGAHVRTDSSSAKRQPVSDSVSTTHDSKTSAARGVVTAPSLSIQTPMNRSRPMAGIESSGLGEAVGLTSSVSQTRGSKFARVVPAPSEGSHPSASSSFVATQKKPILSSSGHLNSVSGRRYPSSIPAANSIHPPTFSQQSHKVMSPKVRHEGCPSGALAPFQLSPPQSIKASTATLTTPTVEVAKSSGELVTAGRRSRLTPMMPVSGLRNGSTPPARFLPFLNGSSMQSRAAAPVITKSDSVESIVTVSDEDPASSGALRPQRHPRPPRQPGPFLTVKGSFSSSALCERSASSAAPVESLSVILLNPAPIPLQNFGATCYLNSIVQCLLCTPGFLHALERDRQRIVHEGEENRSSSSRQSPVNNDHQHSCDGRKVPATSSLIELGTVHPVSTISVSKLLLSLKVACAEYNDEFSSNGQNDAHEFFITLLGVIDREVCRSKPESYEVFKDLENEKKSDAYARWVNRLRQENNSSVYDFFGGITGCTIKCASCNLISYRFEALLDISLPVKYRSRANCGKAAIVSSVGAAGKAIETECVASVDELLRDLFMSERGEFLSGPMQVKCDRCNMLRDKTIWSTMEQWPPILVLHLKRFDNAGVKNGAAVVFPCTFGPCGQVTYELYAVCCHRGTSSFGHYTSYTYVPNEDGTAASRNKAVSLSQISDQPEASVKDTSMARLNGFDGYARHGRSESGTLSNNTSRANGRRLTPANGGCNHSERDTFKEMTRVAPVGKKARAGKWYLCNDQTITEVTAADVLSKTKEVYLLFYRRIDDSFKTTF